MNIVIQIIGFVVSLGIGFVPLFLQYTTVMESIVLVFLSEIIFQLINTQLSYAKTEKTILKIGRLADVLTEDEWLYDQVQAMAGFYKIVCHGNEFDFFTEKAQSYLEQCKYDLEGLARGTYPDEGISPFTAANGMEIAENLVETVSLSGVEYWASERAAAWIEVNEEAVKRKKLKFERIFINTPEELKKLDDAKIFEKMEEGGIAVFQIDKADVHPDLRNDYMIIDRKLVNYLEQIVVDDGQFINKWPININDTFVAKKGEDFDHLKDIFRGKHPGQY